MIFNTFNTLNLALVSLLSIGLTAFGQPFDFKAPDKPGSALSSAADTSAWITSINKAEVKTRDLQARTVNFWSPHIQPTFKVILYFIDRYYTVTWKFDMWVENKNGWARVKAGRSIHTDIEDFTNVHLLLSNFKIVETGDDHVRGTVTLHLTGIIDNSNLVLDLQARVVASKDYTIVFHDPDDAGSTATLGGRQMSIEQWNVDLPPK